VLKRIYVALVRALGRIAGALGILGWLERRAAKGSRFALWLRSLFAIYDVDALVALDLPWWNLVAVDRVDAFLRGRDGARAFEYGSGASTVWLAKRCAEVFSVEHDREWAGVVAGQVAAFDGAELMVVEPGPVAEGLDPKYVTGKPGQSGDFSDYVHAIDRVPGVFDIVVVDGRCRGAALQAALARLADDGLVVFDNPNRARYRPCQQRDDITIEKHTGLTACLPYPDATWLIRHLNPARPGDDA